jgi:hypothetical protein
MISAKLKGAKRRRRMRSTGLSTIRGSGLLGLQGRSALCNEQGKRSLKIGTTGKFDAVNLRLPDKIR